MLRLGSVPFVPNSDGIHFFIFFEPSLKSQVSHFAVLGIFDHFYSGRRVELLGIAIRCFAQITEKLTLILDVMQKKLPIVVLFQFVDVDADLLEVIVGELVRTPFDVITRQRNNFYSHLFSVEI